jgi:phosphoribosylformylglycinamidine cyclo-ligase
LGLPSTGLHTNGYSLARKALFEIGGYKIDSEVGDALAVPHRSYYRSLIDLINAKKLHGLVHITGSGFQGNIPRILPKGVSVKIDRSAWAVPEIFNMIQKCGNVETNEMYRTFNMGIGMLILAAPSDTIEIRKHLENKGETVIECGSVVEGNGEVIFND